MTTKTLTQKEWDDLEEKIRSHFGIKGLFFSDFSTYDAGEEFRSFISKLDFDSVRSLYVKQTAISPEILVIFSTCELSEQNAEDFAAFLSGDLELRTDILERLKI